MEKRLTVQVWSDVICPWCWIAEQRFAQALAEFKYRAHVKVVHRAFRIKQRLAPEPVEQMLREKFGSNVDPSIFLAQVEKIARADGLVYRLDGTWVGDTMDALRVLKLAEREGLEDAVKQGLYKAYFSDHQNLFDRAALTRLATTAGLSNLEMDKLFAGNDFTRAVEDDEREAGLLGITAVPYFSLGETGISGAEETQIFTAALESAWSAEAFILAPASSGGVCDPDGCSIP